MSFAETTSHFCWEKRRKNAKPDDSMVSFVKRAKKVKRKAEAAMSVKRRPAAFVGTNRF